MNEKRIKEVMQSLDGIQPAEASPFLYSKIEQRIRNTSKEYSTVKLIWLAAASFAILILLNIGAIKMISNSKANKSEYQSSSTGYNLVNNNPINYN